MFIEFVCVFILQLSKYEVYYLRCLICVIVEHVVKSCRNAIRGRYKRVKAESALCAKARALLRMYTNLNEWSSKSRGKLHSSLTNQLCIWTHLEYVLSSEWRELLPHNLKFMYNSGAYTL